MRYGVRYNTEHGQVFAEFVRRGDAEEFISRVLTWEVEQGIKFEIVDL